MGRRRTNKIRIGLIDTDLLGRKNHRFPNLALMKISSYLKSKGYQSELVSSYSDVSNYDHLCISKVFTDTPVPTEVLEGHNVSTGGSGFMNLTPLPDEVEHIRPDYNLYKEYLKVNPVKGSANDIYQNASLGYLTRGCPRKCEFCINKNSNGAVKASPLEEFVDTERKYIVLLDDNILACKDREEILKDLIKTGKPFTFKQGLDIRFLTQSIAELLFNESKYWGDYIFAFDDISEYEVIEKKLKLIRTITNCRGIKFYVLTGFKNTDEKDIVELFERLELIKSYNCLPYVMRYQSVDDKPYLHSENRGIYVNVARWCNQPRFFRKLSFREFCIKDNESRKTKNPCSSYRALMDFEKRHPKIAQRYFG